MVAFALAQVGDRYSYGGSGPDRWDCSGLVAAAYARVGITLPHSSGGMRGYGRPVTRGQLAPGDLVLWSGHVAISVGGGLIVAATTPGRGVRVGPIWGTPVAYRRLL